ncbi:MAG: ferritin family protein [Holophagae bacterium]
MDQESTDTPRRDPADLIATAIEAEKKAAWFYGTMAEMTSDASVQTTFKRLSNDETCHARTLTELYVELTGHDVERAPAAAVEGQPDPFDFPSTSRRAALEFALKNEIRAAELYQSQAAASEEPRRAEIYRQLAETELGHAAFLRRQLGRRDS